MTEHGRSPSHYDLDNHGIKNVNRARIRAARSCIWLLTVINWH